MPRTSPVVLTLLAALLARTSPSHAQIDYRNLDHERPIATEDAYPLERYGFELLLPVRTERERDGERVHLLPLQLEHGIYDNTEVGIGLPLAGVEPSGSGTEWGLAGLELSGRYNFNSEGPSVPALAAGADLTLPVGSLAGDGPRVRLVAIATRSFGLTRMHLNAAWAFGSEERPGAIFAPRWSYGLAVDHTLFRRSVLLVAELRAQRAVRGSPVEVNAAGGARYQWTPTLVLDAGIARRLRSGAGPDYALTLGLSHAFGLGALMPGGPR